MPHRHGCPLPFAASPRHSHSATADAPEPPHPQPTRCSSPRGWRVLTGAGPMHRSALNGLWVPALCRLDRPGGPPLLPLLLCSPQRPPAARRTTHAPLHPVHARGASCLCPPSVPSTSFAADGCPPPTPPIQPTKPSGAMDTRSPQRISRLGPPSPLPLPATVPAPGPARPRYPTFQLNPSAGGAGPDMPLGPATPFPWHV